MIENHGVAFRHSDEADFERELAFDRRVATTLAREWPPSTTICRTDVRSSEPTQHPISP